jgi:tetratricopeptide (TPR) repeat protein
MAFSGAHADAATVDQFLAGQVAAPNRGELAAHLDSCPSCHRLLMQRLARFTASRAAQAAASRPQTAAPPAAPPGGRRFGRYLILAELGGGSGLVRVFSAHDTVLDRKVALKLLPASSGAHLPLAHALGEAVALAQLQHPSVAAVYDVGLVDDLPFICTELADGLTLRAWAQRETRGARQIAQVLATAARGLAAAHARGIVHRDVRPDNILVAGTRVLVTDFGLAVRPALGDRGGGGAITPGNLAAEQLLGQPVDARTDVYGLCATLFELVHGVPPFAGLSVEARLQARRDSLPPAPRERGMARLHELAVSGLHPDPAGRPASAEELASQLSAAPAGRGGKALVLGALAAAAALAFWGGRHLLGGPERQCRAGVGAIDGAWNDARRATLARRFAESPTSAPSWTAVERLLDRYADSWRSMHAQTCADSFGLKAPPGQVFDHRSQCLSARRAALQAFSGALASATPEQLSRAPHAVLPEIADCLPAGKLEMAPLPADPPKRAQHEEIDRLLAQAGAEQNLGQHARATDTSDRAVEEARKLGHDPQLAAALVQQAAILIDASDASGDNRGPQPGPPGWGGNRGGNRGGKPDGAGLDRAAKLLQEAAEVAERGRDDRTRLHAAHRQVLLQAQRPDLAEAERWGQLGQQLLTRLGNPPVEGYHLHASLGRLRELQNQQPQAAEAYARALDFAQKAQPRNPRDLANALHGVCATTPGVPDRVACLRRALDTTRTAYGPEHPDTAEASARLAEALMLQPSTHAEACPLFRQARATLDRKSDPGSPAMIPLLTSLARCQASEGQIAEARRLYDEVLLRRPGATDRAHVLMNQGLLYVYYGDFPTGLRQLRAALATFERAFGPAQDDVLMARNHLAAALVRGGQIREAQRVVQAGLDAARKAKLTGPRVADLRAQQGAVFQATSRAELAVTAFQESLRWHQKARSDEPALAFTLHGLGVALLALGRNEPALTHLQRAFAARPASNARDPDPVLRADIPFALARALRANASLRKPPAPTPGTPRLRPCDLVHEAATGYRQLRNVQTRVREADRWIRRNRCSPPES